MPLELMLFGSFSHDSAASLECQAEHTIHNIKQVYFISANNLIPVHDFSTYGIHTLEFDVKSVD